MNPQTHLQLLNGACCHIDFDLRKQGEDGGIQVLNEEFLQQD